MRAPALDVTRSTVARTALALLPWQLAVRGAEALLPIALATWFGRSDATDAYYLGWAAFTVAGSLVFAAFRDSGVVAVLTEIEVRDPDLAAPVRGSLLVHTWAGGTALATLMGTAAAVWAASQYTGRVRAEALAMVPALSVYLVALAVRTFYASMLNVGRRFAQPTIASGVGAVVTVAGIAALRGPLSVVSVPYASMAGEAVAAALLARTARRAGIVIAPTFARPEPLRRMARLVASEVGGGAVTRLNPVVDQLVAGFAGVAGGGTMLKLSADVASVPTSLLQSALLPVLLTHWAGEYATRGPEPVRAAVRRSLAVVVAVLAVASILLWAARGPLLRLLFAHGAMDASGVDGIGRVLPYHLAGVAPFGALLVLARAHVAIQNSRIMLALGALNAALNAALDFALLPTMGVSGVALSTSLTHAAIAVIFFFLLESRWSAASSARRDAAAP